MLQLVIGTVFIPFLAMVPLCLGGLVVNGHPEMSAEYCVHAYRPDRESALERRPEYPSPNSTFYHSREIAWLGGLSDSEIDDLCNARPLKGLPFKNRMLSVFGLFEVCNYPAVTARDHMHFFIHRVAQAQEAFVLRTEQLTPEQRHIYAIPIVSIHVSYNFPAEENYDYALITSIWCGPVAGDVTGMLGSAVPLASQPTSLLKNGTRVSINVDISPYTEIYDGWLYFLLYSFLFPLSCFVLSAISGYYLYVTSKQAQTSNHKTQVQLTVLLVEFICQFLLGVNLVFGGHWSRVGYPFHLQFFFATFLGGAGMTTTFLTALFWHDWRQTTESMKSVRAQKSLLTRFRNHILFIAALFSIMDMVTPIISYYQVPGFTQVLGGINTVSQLTVAIYFFIEVKQAMHFLENAMASSAKKADLTRIRGIARWLFISSCFMMVWVFGVPTMSILGFLYTPYGWMYGFLIGFVARWGTSFAQVMAVAPVRKRKNKVSSKSTKESNGSVVSTTSMKSSFSGSRLNSSIAKDSSGSRLSSVNSGATWKSCDSSISNGLDSSISGGLDTSNNKTNTSSKISQSVSGTARDKRSGIK